MGQVILNALIKYFENNPDQVAKLVEQFIPWLLSQINTPQVNK